jgi:hypothetical protein
MLRHPAQRLRSEWAELQGGISCHGGWWRLYQPVLCVNASSHDGANRRAPLLPHQNGPGEPTPEHDAYYAARRGKAWPYDESMFERWAAVPDNCAHNRMTRQLAPMGCAYSWAGSPAYPGQHHRMLALALEQLRSRTLFGLTERYRDSVRLMNARLARDFAGHPLGSLRLPVPPRRPVRLYNLSAAALKAIQRHNAEDFQLYAHAERLFERLMREYGVLPEPDGDGRWAWG